MHTQTAAPSWFRTSADRDARRAELRRLYRVYLNAVDQERRAPSQAATDRADAAWARYCARRDRSW